MSLNISSVIAQANTILNKILSRYVGLKFIGFNQSDENKPYYLGAGLVVTNGFYYKTKRLPVTGEVVETLRIVPENSTVQGMIDDMKVVELINEDNSFVRFRPKTLKQPHPPNYEWVFLIVPNREDQTTLT